MIIPTVIETDGRTERAFDIYSRLLKERIVFLTGTIDDNKSDLICAQLLFLEADNSNTPLYLYINSPGGVVTSGLAIYDTMQFIKAPVGTLCMGQAASMASLLLAAGRAGMRRALPHSRIMVHEPAGGMQGQTTNVKIYMDEMLRLKHTLNLLYEAHTGQSLKKIEQLIERDHFMTPKEALKWGIIDQVIQETPK